MSELHNKLQEKYPFYAEWHNNRIHTYAHFLILILVSVLCSMAIYKSAENAYARQLVALTEFGQQSADVNALTNQLLHLSKQYQLASAADQPAILSALIAIAVERNSALRKEIQNNPKTFLKDALPPGIVRQLPDEIIPLLEQDVEVTGTLTITHSDNFAENTSKDFYDLSTTDGVTGNRTYHLHFVDKPDIAPGQKLLIKGKALDEEVVAYSRDSSGTQVLTQAAGSSVSGPQNVLVILMNPPDNTSQPKSAAGVADVVFNGSKSVNAYYQDTSYGKVSLTGTVVGWYTISGASSPYGGFIPYTSASCGANFVSAALDAAKAAGVPVANYTHYLYVSNTFSSACGYYGISSLGGNYAFINGVIQAPLIAHELGHQLLSFQHAGYFDCRTSQVAPSMYGNCLYDDYGDRSDVMGGPAVAYAQNNAPHKLFAGFIPSTKTQSVTANGTYTVTPLEINDSTIKVLKIAKKDTSQTYFVSYRQPIGPFDSALTSTLTRGVSIHTATNPPAHTEIIDTTPGNGNYYDAPLSDGASFTDNINGLKITQVSHNGSGAVVSVSFFSAPCIPVQSTVFGTLGSISGASGVPVKYSFTLSNNDNATCPAATYQMISSMPVGWTAIFDSPTLSVSPGQVVSSSMTVTPLLGIADGTYPFSITASDASQPVHNMTTNSNYVSYTDTAPPTINISSPLNGQKLSGKPNIKVTASASDPSGIKSIAITINGSTVATCSNVTSCSYNWSVKNVPAGQYTIKVTAVDASPQANQSNVSIVVIK